MDLFDIVGPIMVGPSSSHTAGAVRMGYVAGKLLGEPIQKAEILLYGSFLATGEGHGTRKAIVAGLLGMQTDDYQISESFEIAAQQGMEVVFGEARLEEAHPNTAVICLSGVSGKQTEVQISSIGGSRISIDKGGVLGLMLAAQQVSGGSGGLTQRLASRVKDIPLAGNSLLVSHVSGHGVSLQYIMIFCKNKASAIQAQV